MRINSLQKINSSTLMQAAAAEPVKPATSPLSEVAPLQLAPTSAAAVNISLSINQGPAQPNGGSAKAPASIIMTSYSATAGGKNYPATVAESAGFYVASVPNPPGQRATGLTIEAAEHNLEVKLDTLA